MLLKKNSLLGLLSLLLLSACVSPRLLLSPVEPLPSPVIEKKQKIALVLGGGAARGFAHIGVIKVLEANGISPDIIVGTSAGSVVGALYANGISALALQHIALSLNEKKLADISIKSTGLIKGDALQDFVNQHVQNKPIEKLSKPFVAVATNLENGKRTLFRSGNTGIAVRASSSIPGLFQPTRINGQDYVDGGLVSPVPIQTAREMGATLIIAVDISSQARNGSTEGLIDVLLQTTTIMSNVIAHWESREADVIIVPDLDKISSTDFSKRQDAIIAGEQATLRALPLIQRKLAQKN